MELLLIRHAQPVRIERTDGGAANPPLSDLGTAQALAMAAWVGSERLDALYVSPMERARQTADPLVKASGLAPVVLAAVAEYDQHEPVYIPIEQLKAMHREGDGDRWLALLAGNQTDERKSWRNQIVMAIEELVGRHRGHNVAVVCHGGVINAYVTHVLGVDNPMVYEPHYTSVNRIVAASSGERTILTLNEAPWLRDLPPITASRHSVGAGSTGPDTTNPA